MYFQTLKNDLVMCSYSELLKKKIDMVSIRSLVSLATA